MNDRACVQFLQDTLPQLHLSWAGFRRVRRQVCRRLQRRLKALGLTGLAGYRDYLAAHPAEWEILDHCCRITISRFYRDRGLFRALEHDALPALIARARARGATALRVWSAGCAAGEEPYTLAILWQHAAEPAFRSFGLDVLATDSDAAQLARARAACYPASSLRELPPAWREAAFRQVNRHGCLRPGYQAPVRFSRHDIRSAPPAGPFDLVLCRNLAFTYFDPALQLATGRRLASVLHSGGLLVLGAHERLPAELQDDFAPGGDGLPVYRRR